MKTTLFLFCLFCTAGALGQSVLVSSTLNSTYQVTNHAAQASPQPMAQTRDLLEGSGSVVIAHGERPLWEFAPVKHEVPLGDVARALKKEKENAKKAEIVFED
jgi:hypothetical protein